MTNVRLPNSPSPSSANNEAGSARPAVPLSNAEVAARVVSGDSALFELLMRRHNRLVFHIARSIVLDDAEAEDVVQETYLRAYLHLAEFRGPRGFTTWLTRIATNEALGRVRKARSWTSLDEAGEVDGDYARAESKGMLMSELRRPDDAVSGEQLLRLIEAAVDRLPEEFRVVFMLRAVDQLGIAETAACLGLNRATVKTRFHRARARLRESLGEQLDMAAPDSFSFGGRRCDRIVATVIRRIGQLQQANATNGARRKRVVDPQLTLVDGTPRVR